MPAGSRGRVVEVKTWIRWAKIRRRCCFSAKGTKLARGGVNDGRERRAGEVVYCARWAS